METTTREHDYLSLGDTVNFYSRPGMPARQSEVQQIELCNDTSEIAGQPVIVVRWDKIDFCIIRLANGRAIHGSKVELFEQRKQYQYPDELRCN